MGASHGLEGSEQLILERVLPGASSQGFCPILGMAAAVPWAVFLLPRVFSGPRSQQADFSGSPAALLHCLKMFLEAMTCIEISFTSVVVTLLAWPVLPK